MNRTEKEQAVEKLTRAFQDSQGVILLDFERISVPDITELRDKIRETGGCYEVVKNRLAIRAAAETPLAELSGLFAGPTAIAYTESDSVALAKALRDFVRANDGMVFKAGVLDGKQLSVDEVEQLAKLPSRDELLSKVMFLVQAPLSQFAAALISPLQNIASILSQLAENEDRAGAVAAEAPESDSGEEVVEAAPEVTESADPESPPEEAEAAGDSAEAEVEAAAPETPAEEGGEAEVVEAADAEPAGQEAVPAEEEPPTEEAAPAETEAAPESEDDVA